MTKPIDQPTVSAEAPAPDIVERLDRHCISTDWQIAVAEAHEGAGEIRKLRAEIERLRAALEMWMDAAKVHVMMDGPMFVSMMHRPAKLAWENARAALTQEPRT